MQETDLPMNTPANLKYAIVTGAAGAIGEAIAQKLASMDYAVTCVARTETQARQVAERIIRSTGNQNVGFLFADLSRKQEIERIAAQWDKPLHLLVNNAATAPRKHEETPEGIEMQFAVNVLGYFWMISAFTPFMKQAESSRIVNVASYWAGDLDIDDLECRSRRYNNDMIYRQSKQANRMLTVAFAEKLKPYGITVNACHPGDVSSKLSNSLGFGGSQLPAEGADTPVFVATSPLVETISGKYFENRMEVQCRFSKNLQAINQLYEICAGYS